jgi:hypothetical protein
MASMGLDVAGGRKNRLKKGVGGGEKLLVLILLIASFLRYHNFLELKLVR